MRKHKFERAPAAVTKLVDKLIKKHHPDIEQAGVTIDLIFCRAETDSNGDPTGPAIMHHGSPAYGVARIVGLKERAMGRADGEISIDADSWDDWSAEQRNALLDHEIFHFIPQKDQLGAFELDDLNRPKLKMRQHDYQFGWFTTIAERHGEASIEVTQAKNMFEHAGQQLFPFVRDVAKA